MANLPPEEHPGHHEGALVVPVNELPPDDLVEQAVERAANKVASAGGRPASHAHPLGIGLLTANIILLLALFFVRAGDRRTILHGNEIVRQGIGCLLADLDDHRHTNQNAHDTLAEKHGFGKIIQPDVIPLTKEQTALFKGLCSEFVKSGTTSLRDFNRGMEMEQPRQAQDGHPQPEVPSP